MNDKETSKKHGKNFAILTAVFLALVIVLTTILILVVNGCILPVINTKSILMSLIVLDIFLLAAGIFCWVMYNRKKVQ